MLKTKPLWIVSLLGLFTVSAQSQTRLEENPKAVKKALINVQSQIQKVEKEIYHTQSKEKNLITQLTELDKAIGEQSEVLRHQQEKQLEQTHSLKALQSKALILQKDAQTHETALKNLLQANFSHTRQEKMRLILEQKDLSSMARLNQYYQYFCASRSTHIQSLSTELKKIEAIQHEIVQETQHLEAVTQKLQEHNQRLAHKKMERTRVLETLAQALSHNTQTLNTLQKQEAHLEAFFSALEKKLAATPAYHAGDLHFAKMKKKLSFPIDDRGATFSVLPSAKNIESKKSYIIAQTGTPVKAIFPGKVVFAEWLRGIGLLLILDHGNGYMSLYGNNQKLYKTLGENVKQGEMIARVGQSGGQAEPGLYFEIRKGRKALDPTAWFDHA